MESIKKELEKYTKYADIRNLILFSVLASFKPEDIDEKITGAKEILKKLDKPIGIPTLVEDIEKDIKVYNECATACKILTWVTDELKNEQCDCKKSEQENKEEIE